MTTYRVRDWDQHYENNKSREVGTCSYVCVPNSQDGMGFTRLMARPEGATVYGIFCLILGACSRQQKPRAGWLTDDGRQTGTPWSVEDMALRWRRSDDEIRTALDVLCSKSVGWLERVEVPEVGGLQADAATANGHHPGTADAVPTRCRDGADAVPAGCRPATPIMEGTEGIEGTAATERREVPAARRPDAAAVAAAVDLDEAVEALEAEGFSRRDADRLASLWGFPQVEVAIRNANHMAATGKLKGTKGGYIIDAIEKRFPLLPQLGRQEMAESRQAEAKAAAERRARERAEESRRQQQAAQADEREFSRLRGLPDETLATLKRRALDANPKARDMLANKDPRKCPPLLALIASLPRGEPAGPPLAHN